MTKFSTKTQVADNKNYMGEKAYIRSPKIELVQAVLTSFIENTYYEKADKRLVRISELVEGVAKKDPEFVAKLAVFARTQFNMRSSVHVLIGELAQVHKGDNLISQIIPAVALRPDDLIEIVAYVQKPIPNQIKKGVAKALTTFNEYQLAKYRANNKKMSLVDVVNLVRPKHTEAIGKLIRGELRNTETWESQLSAAKGDKEKVTAIWRGLLQERKLGYMAALRNLRNIAATNDPETIRLAAEFIANRKAVSGSKQFPFRFLSAYEALQDYTKGISTLTFEKDEDNAATLAEAVTKALGYSIENLPLLPGKTAILSDNSGSMRGDYGGSSAISANSSRNSASIANLFATLYWMRADNTYVGLFGDRLVSPVLDRAKSVFENYDLIAMAGETCGASTEQGIYDFFEEALANKTMVDRVVIFSDMQIGKNTWYCHKAGTRQTFNQLFKKYKEFNPNIKVYSVDLRGYGTTVFSDGIYEFAGFSDKLFSIMEMTDQNPDALVKVIEDVQL